MRQKKRIHPLVVAVVLLLILAIVLCSVAVGIWMQGRKTFENAEKEPELPISEQTPEEESEEKPSFVEYGGKRYQYNRNMVNLLLLGIDSSENPDVAQGNMDQADVLVLAALNLKDNTMTLISLSRDIMCDVAFADVNEEQENLKEMQLALAYAYGDGQHGSCEATRDAVSNIFYGLPIHGYAAYYMNGIEELNDAVGGVTVKIIEDVPFHEVKGCWNMIDGHEVTLTGEQAKLYIRYRLEDQVDANSLRMQRQKQYMLALVSKAKQAVLENPASILTMYQAVDDYVLTDLGIGEISYLATKAAGMNFAGDILNLEGELVLNELNQAEMYLNQESLYDLMFSVFYTEVVE